ncbi:YolD-like family protein [Ureibacillus sinduriensis]|uniref:YolD-like family protein n=1 Tax=Ureibacillus sinduriensis TaxID=561440 RepID=UPI00055FC5E9|nr:YolD-like family protein [Ureibacillus sinduriensis]
MLKDRGNKKWTAMMLTEHVTDLRNWYESDNDIPEPEFDEFSLNSLADDLNIAFQTKSNVRITYWSNKRTENYEGEIIELLPNEQAVRIKINDYSIKLLLKNIVKLNVYD